ncbi:MAG: N-acetylglucosamine transferase [Rhodobacteraceae bacterium]|nr:N-acetylglucosamine transferase [Paracoccaceae bacterium]
MLRPLHRFPGLIAAAFIIVLTISGVIISVLPMLEKTQAVGLGDTPVTVAQLAERVASNFPDVEEISRSPSGRITAFYYLNDQPATSVIDPQTGAAVRPYDASAFVRFVTDLHRSMFMGDGGRIVGAAAAVVMILLAYTGLNMTANRVGGWRKLYAPLRGPVAGRWHVEIARVAAFGLVLSAVTAVLMTLNTFSVIPDGDTTPAFPSDVSEVAGYPLAEMPLLQQASVTDLRKLTFPYPGDSTDVFTLRTDLGTGYVDQGTGQTLDWAPFSAWQKFNEFIYMIHTGQGAWIVGLLLGLCALGAPVLAVTGVLVYFRNRNSRPRIPTSVSANLAETVILVGSESGSTWGFAATLSEALNTAGQSVHVGAMSNFAPQRYSRAKQVIVMAATYGDGAAPAGAKGFLDKLAALPTAPTTKLAVLGFGDRQFPQFCAYAERVSAMVEAAAWPALMAAGTIDRQSPQDFARWGRSLGQALGLKLELNHQPVVPKTHRLTLMSRRDYGADMQAPTSILRFALPDVGIWARLTGRGFARYSAGDLLGILPTGSALPRYYSLASARSDGWVEICVRKHPGGLCSGELMALAVGDTIQAFVRTNPDFRPARGNKPVILIGAGTGIGPLAGFARANRPGRPMHLYFGTRHPDSDYLYREELAEWRLGKKLSGLTTAFSRAVSRTYVQDAIRSDADHLGRMLAAGAQILVCGGRDMATGVQDALADVLTPMGLTPQMLKAQGRYVEDVY